MLVFGLAALVVLAVLLPTIYSITARNTSRGGRVFKYTAIMNTQKDPPDDPWRNSPHELFVASGSVSTGELTVSPSTGSFSSSSVIVISGLSTPEPWITSVRFVSTFTFATTTTAEVWLVMPNYARMSIPSRTYSPGVTYRWTVQIDMYNTSTLKVMPIVPASRQPARIYTSLPMSTYCAYSGGGSMTGLSLSISRAHHNSTHVRWTASITFSGSEWNNRHIVSCLVYTTDSSVINAINTMHGSSISQLWILYVAPNITVYQGDMLVVEVWIVAPTTV
ncbi:hypothetical protein [Chloroflexus sp.]|uniref:hypothetical protein n=1 Tax=Chloroflexus sp. TaxID=1904827 RepID=UPI002ACEA427|nr:hypothetical protein [Chloroflexus sp.]